MRFFPFFCIFGECAYYFSKPFRFCYNFELRTIFIFSELASGPIVICICEIVRIPERRNPLYRIMKSLPPSLNSFPPGGFFLRKFPPSRRCVAKSHNAALVRSIFKFGFPVCVDIRMLTVLKPGPR